MGKVSKIAAGVITFFALSRNVFATGETPISAGINNPTSFQNVSLGNIPQFLVTLLIVVGVIIAVVFLIYGGIKWILSGGDEKQVEGARNHIVAAIIGLIIVIGAFVILNVVFQILGIGNLNLKELKIPTLNAPNATIPPTTP